MPGLDFQRLRSEISKREVLERLGFVAVNDRGDQLYGAFPLHAAEKEQPTGEEATGTPSPRL